VDRIGTPRLMCPLSTPSTPLSVPGRKRSISDPSVRACIQELRAHLDLLESNGGSLHVASESYAANCRLPLSLSQSRLLAALVTTFVPRSTWWSTREVKDSWALFGEIGEDSGPRVTVFITATSDSVIA